MSIRRKLILLFLALSILPLAAIGIEGYLKAKESLREATLSGLHSVAEFQKNAVRLYLDKLKSTTRDFASDGWIRDNLERINADREYRELRIQGLNTHLAENKRPLVADLVFVDVLDPNGTVVASSDPARIGAQEGAALYFQRGLRSLYATTARRFTEHTLELDIAAPLLSLDEPRAPIGVLVNHFTAGAVDDLLAMHSESRTASRTMGATGESYLVDRERLMISASVHVADAGFRQTVDTEPVRTALGGHGEESRGTWRNYLGQPVVGASEIVAFDDTTWVLVAEQQTDEAFAPLRRLRANFLTIGTAVLILVVCAGLAVAHRVSSPLVRLTGSIDEIAAGRLGATIEDVDSGDEIGRLARAFNQMSERLLAAHDELEAKNRALHDLSIRDGLTGLYNHRHLKQLLEHEFNRAVRYHLPLCCLVIDLDHFKALNDEHGHLFGDFVLREFGALLHNLVRNTDIAGRYGGEEFLVILTNTPLDQAPVVAARIRERIAAHSFSHQGITRAVTVSIGVAGVTREVGHIDVLIAAADRALYDAKHGGRNRIKVA